MKQLLTMRDDIFTIKNFFTPEECQKYIDKCESIGFGEATINTVEGAIVNKRMRNNERVISDDFETAGIVWERIKEFLPEYSTKAVGVNERFRYYRYEPKQFFDWHFDGEFRRSTGEFSRLTLMIYLNDDFTGGTTDFNFNVGVIRDSDSIIKTIPEKGMALVFVHHVLHRGSPVSTGKKYVMRSDIMFCGR
jgi:predicted 2-oxoglutarate/Fe(II)-dependent dioxygenase YbiX